MPRSPSTMPARRSGHGKDPIPNRAGAASLAGRLASMRPATWGIEGAWGYGRGLAQHLVGQGETVYEINARWTALRRRSAHKPGKTDQLDSLAIALFVRQEGDRPSERPARGRHRCARAAHRASAMKPRPKLTASAIRFTHSFSRLDPEYKLHLPPVNSKAGLDALQHYSPRSRSPCSSSVRA